MAKKTPKSESDTPAAAGTQRKAPEAIPPAPGGFTVYLPVVAGWILPGGGHFWQRKWGRGLLLLGSVAVMFFLGLGMRGKIYRFNPGDIVDTLAWLADLGAGGLYLAASFFGYQVPEPPSAVADYGTKFLLVAGLLNALAVLDAYDIAVGKKA